MASLQRTRFSNRGLALGLVVGIASIGLAPVAYMLLSPTSKVDGSRELPAHTSVRGAYLNTGSKDAGPDRPLGELAQSGLHGAGLGDADRLGVAGRPNIRGLYMFGGVGCGKTMLMDLLVEAAPREFQVRRVHFHDFMLDVHARLRTTSGEADPLRRVADGVAADAKVLALDELFVTDVADAMILHRLFGRLWEDGLVLVATSNRAPDALYENGLQRPLFLPFIARLKEQCVVHDMASPVDYRRLAHHAHNAYFLTPDRTARLHAAFLEAGADSIAAAAAATTAAGAAAVEAAAVEAAAGGGQQPQERAALAGPTRQPGPVSVAVAMGRHLRVPQALGAAAMFDFDELCNRPLAAADYIALATAFSTVALADVPVFGAANRAAGYRFVTLVDVLYEHRVRLLVSADAAPFELFERVVTQADARRAGGTTHGHLARAGGGGASSSGSGSTMQLQHGFSSSSSGDVGGAGAGADGDEAVVDDQLGFAKERTISRLTEMQSVEYALAHAKAHAPRLVLALEEMQAKGEQQQQRR